MNIQEMVGILSNTNLRRFVDILICKVLEIDKTDNTISCICLNDIEYEIIEGVQLNIDFDVNSQITYPEIGSTVLVIYQASIGGVAFHFTATDNFEIKTDKNIFLGVENSTVNINTNEIEITQHDSEIFLDDIIAKIGSNIEGENNIIINSDTESITIGNQKDEDDIIANAKNVINFLKEQIKFLNELKIATSTFLIVQNSGMSPYKAVINTTQLQEIEQLVELGTVITNIN